MTDPSPPAGAPPAVFVLLADGMLRLECEPARAHLLRRWLPLIPWNDTASADDAAVIRIRTGDPAAVEHGRGDAALRLGTARVWVDAAARHATFHAPLCAGSADLAHARAEVVVAEDADDEAASWALYSVVTLLCAMMLGRLERALVHAAAVVAPDGGAWLLTGDSHAGKSTTSVNLIEAGWRFVSDDNVVLFRDGDGRLTVEGWPRLFHLDRGWAEGRPGQVRGDVNPHERWPGRWLRTAPLAGLLFPRVEAGQATELGPVAAADALARLLRQSPWLLGDRARAPRILALLRSACERPCHSLRLGLDTYRDTDQLLRVLAPLSSAS